MRTFRILSLLLAVGLLMAWAPGAFAISDIERGRAIIERYREAVITVQVVVKMKFGNQENEMKMDAVGTVIGADGLTVVSLTSIDPSAYFRNMGMGSQMKIESEVASMSLLLPGGEELPAKEILRDNVLDLAYVRPLKRPESGLSHVDLSDAGEVDILDRVIALNRLGKVSNRVHSAAFEQVEAVVRKPRTFYVPASDPTNTSQGSPAFSLDGKIVGIFVIRTIKATGGAPGDNVAAIILPAEDVLDGAQQAPGFDE